MNPIAPMYRISPDDETEADVTDTGRVIVRIGGINGLGLLFDDVDAANVAVDQLAHDLAVLRAQKP